MKLTPPQLPMRCQDYNEKHLKFPVIVQPKLNGQFAQSKVCGDYFTLWTKTNKRYPDYLVDHILKELRYLPYEQFLGELWIPGETNDTLYELVSPNRKSPHPSGRKVGFYVFDLVGSSAFEYRYSRLQYMIQSHDLTYAKVVPVVYAENLEELNKAHESNLLQSYEGSVIRRAGSSYQPGKKSWDMMRLKPVLKMVVRVIGVTQEYDQFDRPKGRMGALICLTPEGKLFKVGTGFDADERVFFWKEFKELCKHVKTDADSKALVNFMTPDVKRPESSITKWSLSIEYERLSAYGIPLKPRMITYFPSDLPIK